MVGNKNGDRFSDLTDSLLLTIVSFLPFKEAARTSVLSKHWRNIWRETLNIEFNENFFVKQKEQHSDESTRETQRQRRDFIDFSRQWIRQYSLPTVNKFSLVLSNPRDNVSDTQEFIRFAISRRARFLDLDFSNPTWNEQSPDDHRHDGSFELPSFVYENRNLESIRLFSCNFTVSEFKNFSALKSLSLGWIKLSNFSFATLSSNCRFIETLSLEKCWGIEFLEISSPCLKTLVLYKCIIENGINIEAPKLKYFKYSGSLIVFSIEYLNALGEADLDFGFESEFSEDGDLLYELLGHLWCTRVLTVCSFMLQVIPTASEYPKLRPPLEGVKHLILKTALHAHEYHGISFFLSSCPRLERLTIDMTHATRIFPERETSHELEEHDFLTRYKYKKVYGCMRSSLRMVEIKGFKGDLNELVAMKYFIMYGRALEILSIALSKEKGPGGIDMESSYLQNAQKLLQFGRASRSLRIFIN